MMTSEKARTLPKSKNSLSLTFNIQVPFGFSPLKAESASAGLNVPCQGLPAGVMSWISFTPLSSSIV